MVSVTHTVRSIEITAGNLQEEVHRLEAQRQALERELAAVVAHLGSVQQALAALQELMQTASPTASGPVSGRSVPEPVEAERTEPDGPSDPAGSEGRVRTSEGGQERTRPTQRASDRIAQDQGKYGKLTEQIMEFFAGTGGAAVRARDVAAALGRDTDTGSINAVRSTLDRLVGTSRIQRAGRGLYRAHSS
ncbi:hypothetical protein [Streptomyces sp. NPDC086010]|uniref:hypothetical protein n=1 Tax=Streptomyces sp. NPDC086010 TaxID=3365745 RepID=UPI0037D81EA0